MRISKWIIIFGVIFGISQVAHSESHKNSDQSLEDQGCNISPEFQYHPNNQINEADGLVIYQAEHTRDGVFISGCSVHFSAILLWNWKRIPVTPYPANTSQYSAIKRNQRFDITIPYKNEIDKTAKYGTLAALDHLDASDPLNLMYRVKVARNIKLGGDFKARNDRIEARLLTIQKEIEFLSKKHNQTITHLKNISAHTKISGKNGIGNKLQGLWDKIDQNGNHLNTIRNKIQPSAGQLVFSMDSFPQFMEPDCRQYPDRCMIAAHNACRAVGYIGALSHRTATTGQYPLKSVTCRFK